MKYKDLDVQQKIEYLNKMIKKLFVEREKLIEKQTKMYPDKYVPTVLRKDEYKEKDIEIRYGIGIEHGLLEFGMIDGPFEDLETALEIVPFLLDKKTDGLDPGCYLLELPTGKKLYKWSSDYWSKV